VVLELFDLIGSSSSAMVDIDGIPLSKSRFASIFTSSGPNLELPSPTPTNERNIFMIMKLNSRVI
jgi:hypothetical protein